MKKLLTIIFLSLVLVVSGCGAEVIGTETREVDVLIIDSYHRDMWLQPIITGKVTSFIIHPEVNRIDVSYEGGTYSIEGDDIYDEFHDNIGDTVTGVLEIYTRDDGSIRQKIVDLI